MMCDIMPTISEDPPELHYGQNEETNFEQLMVNMLDERDKLMETLRETQDSLALTRAKLSECQKEKDSLMNHLESVLSDGDDQLIERLAGLDGIITDSGNNLKEDSNKNQVRVLAEDFAAMLKELNQAREQLLEKDEEISELKSERCNTRLLLEHLECLVARHERSLRMTVVKRQAATTGGVSSEVEVLKALKSLFEHHKALDEKCLSALYYLQHLSNGPIGVDITEHEEQMEEMQFLLDKRTKEVERLTRENKDLKERCSALEEELRICNKQLDRGNAALQRLERDLDEAAAQKSDMEDRITTLEKRYVRLQHDVTALNDDNERLETELASKESDLIQAEDKVRIQQEKLELAQQNLNQSLRKAEALPKIEEELAVQMAALNEAAEKHVTAEETVQQLQTQLQDLQAELSRAREREKMNEDHNARLSSTIEKLLGESNERLQNHQKERMTALEEKAALTQDLDSVKLQVEDLQREKEILALELGRLHEELRKQRNGGGHDSTVNAPVLTASEAVKRETKGRAGIQESPSRVLTLNEQEWQKLEQESVLKNVALAFDNSRLSDIDSDAGSETSEERVVGGDAQSLAALLQQQIDVINNELKYSSYSLSCKNLKFPYVMASGMGLDTRNLKVKSSKEGSLNNLSDAHTPPTPSSSTSDSTESSKPSQTGNNNNNNLVPEDMANVGPSTNGMVKIRDNSEDSLPSATSTTSSAESLSKNSSRKKGIKSSIGRIFGNKTKSKHSDTYQVVSDSESLNNEPTQGSTGQRELDRKYKNKSHLLAEALAAGTPFALWNAPTVVAWLEVTCGSFCPYFPFSLRLPPCACSFMCHASFCDVAQSVLFLLEKRRQMCEDEPKDVLVWSNERIVKWLKKIGLTEYADNLRGTGVHGAVIALDETFDFGTLAYALQIPSQNTQIRQILDRGFNWLLANATDREAVDELGNAGEFKRSKSWRKMFKQRDKGKDRSRGDRELVRRNSSGSESSLSQSSVSSSPKSTAKNTKHNSHVDNKDAVITSGNLA
ncbi:PREDICTED: liprin-alpha-1-like [Acropora digitifera]|uniref:liprin-alpha-1-like n=1 Tax=Acropora digitifera TaxID=70779 RepID=UPI00077A4FC6|nr:PREDICTED: liprin-alpha-1-like [Acropora digitifera]